MTARRVLALTLVGLLSTAGPSAAQLLSTQPVSMATARQVAAAAEAVAVTTNAKVAIAIVDAGGNPVYLHRMAEVPIASIRRAIRNATAALRRPRLAQAIAALGTGGAAFGVTGVTQPGGGIPVVVDGKVLGAVGVSGLAPQQDAPIAQAAADTLLKLLSR